MIDTVSSEIRSSSDWQSDVRFEKDMRRSETFTHCPPIDTPCHSNQARVFDGIARSNIPSAAGYGIKTKSEISDTSLFEIWHVYTT